jgi:hypothetical protein
MYCGIGRKETNGYTSIAEDGGLCYAGRIKISK